MSMPLPSGVELTAVVAVAIALSLTGMWLTRSAAHLIGYDSKPPARSASHPGGGTHSRHQGRAFAIAMPDWLRLDRWPTAWRTVLAKLSGASENVRLRRPVRRHSAAISGIAAKQAIIPAPQRLTIEAQWERTANLVGRAVSGARTVRAAHVAASEKLDAAHYALDKLMEELEGIISLSPSQAQITVLARAPNVVSLRRTSAAAARAAA